MATQTDFWGEIVPAEVRTPVAILREQAALLGSKTQNVVEAKVSTQAQSGKFYHRFRLVVPALDYTYELFKITTGVNPYPVTVDALLDGTEFKTEEAFTNWLKAKLSSAETKQIISNLLAQATT
jgi:hypothetical protein